MTELEMVVAGWERHRAVTLQFLDALDEAELGWRPTPAAMSCGQQPVHIARTEDFPERGLFAGEWSRDLLRFPKPMPPKKSRDIERTHTAKQFVSKLHRLADCIENDKRFAIQVGGERTHVPPDAMISVEHERERKAEEVEFQIKWTEGQR